MTGKIKILCLLTLHFMISLSSIGQISTEQARSVDSTVAFTTLASGNFHTENIHSTLTGDTLVWDAGSGLYTGISGYYIGWSHTDKVDEETATSIRLVPGQSYKTFNLEEYSSQQDYKNTLEAWLENIGIPLSINQHKTLKTTLFPNPFKNIATINADLKTGKAYNILITSQAGKAVCSFRGIVGEAGLVKPINLSELAKGIYIFTIQTDNKMYRTKGIKQ